MSKSEKGSCGHSTSVQIVVRQFPQTARSSLDTPDLHIAAPIILLDFWIPPQARYYDARLAVSKCQSGSWLTRTKYGKSRLPETPDSVILGPAHETGDFDEQKAAEQRSPISTLFS